MARSRHLLGMRILAIGGAGNVGSEVVKELLKRGVHVDVLVRKPDAKVPQGARAVVGDLLDPVSVEKALDGVDKLISAERRHPG